MGYSTCIECTNKGDELYDVSTCCMKFLKYDSGCNAMRVEVVSKDMGVRENGAKM
jgi:hypothetical protein